MPMYDYKCDDCGNISEHFFKMTEKPYQVTCPDCSGSAHKVLSASLVLGDDMPPWMRDPETLGCLQNPYEKPIETRSEYKKYLKKNNVAEM